MKKLVPATLSSNSSAQAASNTPNASKPRIAVRNHAQHVSGMRINERPGARRSISVVMKFNAPISEAGSTILPSAESGVYAVQPEIGAPSSTKNAQTITTSDTNVVQNDSMFRTGKAISAAPI